MSMWFDAGEFLGDGGGCGSYNATPKDVDDGDTDGPVFESG